MRLPVIFMIFASFLLAACTPSPEIEVNLPVEEFEKFECYAGDTECMKKAENHMVECRRSIITIHSEMASDKYTLEKDGNKCKMNKRSLMSSYSNIKGTDMDCRIPMSDIEILKEDEFNYFKYCEGIYKENMQNILAQFSPVVAQ